MCPDNQVPVYGSMLPVFCKRADVALPLLRITASGDQASITWRIRSVPALLEHRTLFLSHGMLPETNHGHYLVAVGMAPVAAQAIISSMTEILASENSLIDKYTACYAVMQPHMSEVAGKTFPKVTLQQHPTDPQLARPQWKVRTGKKMGAFSTGGWTHKATLRIMVDEVNAKLATLDSVEACNSCILAFVARQRQTATRLLNQGGKLSMSLEASKRSSKLHDAQASMLTKNKC